MQEMMDGFTSAKCRVGVSKGKGERVKEVYKRQKKASFPLINFAHSCFNLLSWGLILLKPSISL